MRSFLFLIPVWGEEPIGCRASFFNGVISQAPQHFECCVVNTLTAVDFTPRSRSLGGALNSLALVIASDWILRWSGDFHHDILLGYYNMYRSFFAFFSRLLVGRSPTCNLTFQFVLSMFLNMNGIPVFFGRLEAANDIYCNVVPPTRAIGFTIASFTTCWPTPGA